VTVAGVDGCRDGWVIAQADADDGALIDVAVVPSFVEVARLLDHDVEMIAVDMPIGLPEAGARACDREARRLLGPRRSTVFPAPPRALLDSTDYHHALARKRAIDGSGLSKQTYFLLPKIAEIDAALTPVGQESVVEAHPELAFLRLMGTPLLSKHTDAGLQQRLDLVEQVLHDQQVPLARPARIDDVLDAIVLTVTARALLSGTAQRLGDGARDARGLAMEIAW
jgi:predicted RNase H-like nuclease